MKYTCLLLLFCMKAFGQCPVISQQPENQSDCEGNSIRMRCIATPGAIFQWERKRPTDANFTIISGATGSSYQILPSGDANNPSGTMYRAKVSLGTCSIYSNPAEISLHKINSILNPGICERGSGILEVQMPDASAASATTYQWSRSTDGQSYSDISDDTNFSGAQTKNLKISNALLGFSGQKFKVRVLFSITSNNDNEGSLTNENQTTTCPRTSTEVSLQIKSSPVPVHSATIYKGCLGAPIGINSTGCSPYTTQWYDANQQKIGTGARISVLQLTNTPMLYKATCIKLGCESLASAGTSAQAFDIPAAPLNAGTPSAICSGNTIVFKATGGTNNIWYLTESAMSSLSTATNLNVNSTGNLGSEPFKITRWVSQKINECESPRTAIEVLVPPALSASAGQSTTITSTSFYDTKAFVTARGGTPPYRFQWTTNTNAPILSPTDANPIIGPFSTPGYVKITLHDQLNCIAQDSIYISLEANMSIPPSSPMAGNPDNPSIPGPIVGGNEPITGEPDGNGPPLTGESSDEGTNLLPPAETPTIYSEPKIPERTMMEVKLTQHCDTESYDIEVSGCPSQTNFYNQYGPEIRIGSGNNISFQVSYEKYVTIRCDGGNADPINLTLKGLQRPIIHSNKNFNSYLCAGDQLELKANLPKDTQFIAWEKDGHIISESQTIKLMVFETGQYQPIVNKLGCYHRGEIISIPVHPMAKIPSIQVARHSICVQDSLRISLLKPEAFFEWNVAEKSSTILRKTNTAGKESFKARQSIDGYCWSDWSPPQEVSIHPLPEKPRILPLENQQMCDGEIRTLHATKAFAYQWNTDATEDSIQVYQSGKFFLHTRNEWGCLSPRSDDVFIYNRPKPELPILFPVGSFFLQAQNSNEVSAYEWTWKDRFLVDTSAKIKTYGSGIYYARAKKTYFLEKSPTIQCWSPHAKIHYEIQEEHEGFSVYPNPSTGEKINIEIWKDIRQGTLSLIDFRGIILQTWEFPDSKDRMEINISGMKQGQFVLRLNSPDYQTSKVLLLNP
jgi:hypothetical protein